MSSIRSAALSPLLAVSVVVAFLPAGESRAQSDTSTGIIEELVVTARKREEALQDVPTTLQVFSGAELARDGVREFRQIQQSVPNFNFFSDRGARANVQLRGFGGTNTVNLAPGVGIYVDGVYQPSTTFFNAPFVDLERMEFLKGPQGTLFGRNAYAGAINIVTRPPGDELEATVQAEAANGDTRRAFASVSGPLVEGRLRGLLSAGLQEQEGFFKYAASGNPADPNDYVNARGRLAFDVTERFTLDLTAQYFDLDTGGFRTHGISGIDDTRENVNVNEPQFEDGEFRDAWLNARWSLQDFDLIGIASYSDQTNLTHVDGDLGPNVLIDYRRVQDRMLWSQELRAQSTGERRFNWLAGLYYSKSEIDSDELRSGGFFPAGPLNALGEEDAEIRSIFADATLALTDRLELGAGLRYDEIEKQGSGANILLRNVGGPLTLSSVVLDDTYRETQPKVSLRYALTPDVNAYATYAKGFREGGLNLNAPGTEVESFPSDEVKSYEVGLKSALAGGSVNANVALFYMDAPSYNSTGVFVIPGGGAVLVTRNNGAAESYGIEADLVAQLSEAWSLSAAAGWIDAEYVGVTGASPNIRVGYPVQLTPEWSASLSARGEFPLSGSGLRIEVIGGVTAKGQTVMFFGPPPAIYERDSYALFDLSAGLAGERWRAVLFGRNLADERYPEFFNPASALAPFGATSDIAQYNQPRTYGVRVEFRY